MGKGIFKIYCYFLFAFIFLSILPFLYFFSLRKITLKWAGWCYKFWATTFIKLAVIPVKMHKFKNIPKGPVVYCPNHSSYFDIVLLYYVLEKEVCFLGKSELGEIPIFGSIFKRVHISVNRSSAKQGADSLIKVRQALEEGRSVVIFPEGTIKADIQPDLLPFKDGAFRVSKQSSYPIIPVYMPFNHQFMPDDGKFCPNWHPLQVHFGEPIDPNLFKDEYSLKNATRQAMEQLRSIYYPHFISQVHTD